MPASQQGQSNAQIAVRQGNRIQTKSGKGRRLATRYGLTSHRLTPADEDSLSEWRLTGVQHAPLILGITHLLIAITCMALSTKQSLSSFSDNPLSARPWFSLSTLCGRHLALHAQRLELPTPYFFRILCVYLALAGALWTWFGQTVAGRHVRHADRRRADHAMAPGIAMRTIVSISSPPLALVNTIVSTFAAFVLPTRR